MFSQRGFMSWQLLIIILFFGMVLTFTFKLGPHYLDNRFIDQALKELARDNPDLASKKNSEIMNQLNKFMTVNNVRGKEANSFVITRREGVLYVSNVYEVRVP